ncbi:MAG TPA: restriction endonuclease subunit S [Syntrophorhabdaceae bacterium]|nr:restriction endonuclease subunit S [Syntrophorhabdaceae bacterium]
MKFRWETEFKETEIGEIPGVWEVGRLKDVLRSLESGNRPKGGVLAHNPNGILNIGGENINWDGSLELKNCLRFEENFYNNLKKGKMGTGDILLVKDGATIGKLAYICEISEGKAMVNEHVFLLKSDISKVDSRFLYYFLFSETGQQQIESSISGSAQGGINKSIQDNILVFCPPLPEQSRIAIVLSWFDDLTENKKKQNEILEKTAMAIFKSWFVDFEPFKDGEFVYNEELGKEIPKGWAVMRIGEVADFKNGISYRGSEKFSEPHHESFIFITLNNIIEGGGFKTEYVWIKSERIKKQHLLSEGDIIFANTEQTKTGRLLGTPAFVIFPTEYSKSDGVFSHHLTKINPKDNIMKFLLYLTFRLYQQELAQSFHTGTGEWGFDLPHFKINYSIALPPSPILQQFHSLVEPLFQKIILNQKQIMTLRKIRDTFLPLLVFGKLRVEEI